MLVVVEVALALVLLVGSALLIRTRSRSAAVDPGFDARNVLTMRMSLAGARFREVRGGRAGHSRRRGAAARRARRRAGERHVLRATSRGLWPALHDRRAAAAARGPVHGGGQWKTVSPGYFEVFKIPVKRGRSFTERDTARAPGVVIINEAMAQAVLAGRRPAERSHSDRPRRSCASSRTSPIGRSSASSATRATAELNNDPAADDVHPAGARCRTRPTR